MKGRIDQIEWNIKKLAEQENTTIESCLEEYEHRRKIEHWNIGLGKYLYESAPKTEQKNPKGANARAILGAAASCIAASRAVLEGVNTARTLLQRMSGTIGSKKSNNKDDWESAMHLLCDANRAYGIAKVEFKRTETPRRNLEKALDAVTKYTAETRDKWRKYIIKIDPEGKLKPSQIAREVAKEFALPKQAIQSIRKEFYK